MPIKRIREYPRPGKLEKMSDVETYLKRLVASLNEESVQRIKDFTENNNMTELDDLKNTDLDDPGADGVVVWDDSDDQFEFFTNTVDWCNLVGTSRLGSPTVVSQCQWNDSFGSAGRRSGGTITDAGSQTVNVAAGTGFIKTTDSDTANLLACNWSASNGISVPTGTVRYFGVEYDSVSGVAQVVTKTSYTWDLDTDFPLGVVVNVGDVLHVLNNPWWVTDGITNIIERIESIGTVYRDVNVGGLMFGETGTRNITMTAGKLWSRLNENTISAVDTSSGDTYTRYYRAAPSGWTAVTGATAWPNDKYDDGTGTLHNLDSNRYMNLWFYVSADDHVSMVYGQAEYANLAQVEAESPPASVPDEISELGILAARFIIQQGASTANAIESAFDTVFTPTLAYDHGNLTGLGDDDHSAIYYNQSNIDGKVEQFAGTTIADDDFDTITPTATVGWLLIRSGAGNRWAIINYKTTATERCYLMNHSGEFEVTTGALDGTTGTDAKITVSSNATDGKLYIENRIGASALFYNVTLGALV